MLEISIAEGKNPVGTTAANTNPITIGGVDGDNKIVGLVLNADGSITAKLAAGTAIAGKFIPVDADGDEKFTAANPGSVQLSGSYVSVDAVIALNGTLSTEIDFQKYKYLSFLMPAEWTAATLTIKGSAVTGGTKRTIKNDVGITFAPMTVAVDEIYSIDVQSLMLAGVFFLALEASVAQAAARTIKVMLKA